MKKLQVLIDNKWEYVFCRNVRIATPITTENKSEAINAHQHSFAYFTRFFPEFKFQYSEA